MIGLQESEGLVTSGCSGEGTMNLFKTRSFVYAMGPAVDPAIKGAHLLLGGPWNSSVDQPWL